MNTKINIDNIIKESFSLWKASLKYNLLFSIFHFGLYFIFVYGAADYWGVLQKIQDLYPILLKNRALYLERIAALSQTPEFISLSITIIICAGILFPLNIGLLNIIKKIDKKEDIFISDLFIGFSGIAFFKYTGYYLFWIIIYNSFDVLYFPLSIMIKIIWITITLLVTPQIHFKNEPVTKAMIQSFSTAKKNFTLVSLCVLTVIAFNTLGFSLFVIGYLFTFPLWGSVIYILFKYLFPEEIKVQN